ncbi:DUF4097 family beta strand repeat-containing protein [Tautonia plasticadhaerens]|uniref:DUF4097 domain-containing protein n=1 Tax=Tautonia plasticadhaerens TaxID=2527974 RepID=A0A518GY84_9BACT|nr:DUF4097 family beta strand repeat-containing protein [Tautonia plasticadhaerens]QDV33554.1 hypothetical protein ElP_14280 [Tautonia plasticadhaerens]
MCKKRRCSTEGIRFLDENANPAPAGPSPAPKTPGKRRREWPIGTMTFLAVVGVGGLIRSGALRGEIEAKAVIEDRVEVDDAPRIEVETFEGPVRIHRGAVGEVSYQVETSARGDDEGDARRALDLIRPVIRADRGAVRIRVDHANTPGGWSGHAEVRLEVPADSQVRVVTRNGRVRVEEIHGSVAVKTGNGRIEVEDSAGPIVLETSNGSIDCEADDAIVSAETSNGSISFRGSLAPGSSRLTTSNGSVDVELPEHGRFRIDADSRNGRVVSDFPLDRGDDGATAVLASSDGGSADPRLLIRTRNGAIRIEQD